MPPLQGQLCREPYLVRKPPQAAARLLAQANQLPVQADAGLPGQRHITARRSVRHCDARSCTHTLRRMRPACTPTSARSRTTFVRHFCAPQTHAAAHKAFVATRGPSACSRTVSWCARERAACQRHSILQSLGHAMPSGALGGGSAGSSSMRCSSMVAWTRRRPGGIDRLRAAALRRFLE